MQFLDPRSSILDPQLLLALILPLVISLLGTAALSRWALRLGLVDIPNDRKIHFRAIPTGGGLAIFAAWAITISLPWFQFDGAWVVAAAALIIVLLGLADDYRPLPWQFRLAVQTAATMSTLAFLAILNGARYSSLVIHYSFWPLAVFWIVGLVNAFNMLDNMDALSGGIAWIAAALFVVALLWGNCASADENELQPESRSSQSDTSQTAQQSGLSTRHSRFTHSIPYFLAFVGAVTGFLWFNRPPARIFMGDAGSTFLGFILGIAGFQSGLMARDRPRTWIIPLCILAIPWYDLISVVFIRCRQGRSPFQADKQHLSHRLVSRGLSPRMAVGVICLLALIIGGGGLLIGHVGEHGSLFALLYLICCWIGLALFEYWTRRNRELRIRI